MRAIVTRNRPDMVREKALVTDWPEPEPPAGNQFQTQTIYTAMTNGTERNQLTRGNYAPADARLPRPHGYQNVGKVIAAGAEVKEVQPGDTVFMAAPHVEYVVMPLDGGPSKLPWVKMPEGVDLQQAAFLGLASIATHSCRYAEIRLGEKVLVVGAGCVGQFAA